MDVSNFFYKIFKYDLEKQCPILYLGSCFSISPDKKMLTCRHVVNIDLKNTEVLRILDNR